MTLDLRILKERGTPKSRKEEKTVAKQKLQKEDRMKKRRWYWR